MKKADIIQRYRGKAGFKLTPQRLAILEYLEGNTGHPTAEKIFSDIRKTYPTVSFATVYNTLQALRDLGDLVELTIDRERRHYDPDTSVHHHAICSTCGSIEDVFADCPAVLATPAALPAGFKATASHVNFYGVCKTCAAPNF